MILFSNKTTDLEARFTYGYLFLVLMIGIFMSNMIPSIIDSILLYKENKIRVAKEKRMLEVVRSNLK